MEYRSVKAGQGWRWIVESFALFKKNPPIWMVLFVMYFVMLLGITLIPLLGLVVPNLLQPIFIAGLMMGCRDLEKGQELEMRHLFAGFMHNTGQLLTVGALMLVGGVIVAGLTMMAGGGTMLGSVALNGMMGGEPPDVPVGAMGSITVALLVALLLLTPLLMAYWFAPVLVFFHGMPAPQAMLLSFKACLANMLPMTVFGTVAFILMFIGMIPLGLGMLVVMPLILIAIYTGYKDIFIPPPETAVEAPAASSE